MSQTERRFAGGEWLQERNSENISPLGIKVANLLGDVFEGLYHLSDNTLNKVDWTDTFCISVNIEKCLCTWDFDHLTRLVVLCHDRCIRMEINSKNMQYIGLMFHERQREGHMDQRHPTIENAIMNIRKVFGD